jgi:glycosyltransferase involved in cell wall biosynthesis
MRVLIVSDVTSWMPGGVPAETRDLVNGLVARGHVVALATDAPLRGAPVDRHFAITIPVTTRLGAEIRSALAEFAPDFVHVICMSSKGVAALLPVLGARRWALTAHSVSPYERKLALWHGSERLHYAARSLRFLPNTLAWRWLLRRAAIPTLIVHSNFMVDVVTRYGAPRERVALIPLAFHPRAPSPRQPHGADDGPLLVTVGGLAHSKGQHDVVKSLPSLLQRFPRLCYQLVGEVRDRSYLRWIAALARDLGVAEQVRVTPDLSQEGKAELLARADVYVQPSHEEGFCLAYAEAAAVVPRLVGADAGAIDAMSRDDPGARVVAPGSPEAIAQAVLDLLATELPADHMSSRAARLSLRFSYDDYLRAHERLYAA